MNPLIAPCGCDCEKCDARIATMTHDDALRETTAKKWAEMNHAPITPESLHCMGCRTEGVKFAYCSMCEIRACAMKKGFETCGQCGEINSCSTIAPILEHNPAAKQNLMA